MAYKWSLSGSAVDGSGVSSRIAYLSDGSFVFAVPASGGASTLVYRVTGHDTATQIASFSNGTLFGALGGVAVDSSDNIYGWGSEQGNTSTFVVFCLANSGGPAGSWTVRGPWSIGAWGDGPGESSGWWCDTTGGTDGDGYLLLGVESGGVSFISVDAGAMLTSSVSTIVDSFSDQNFIGYTWFTPSAAFATGGVGFCAGGSVQSQWFTWAIGTSGTIACSDVGTSNLANGGNPGDVILVSSDQWLSYVSYGGTPTYLYAAPLTQSAQGAGVSSDTQGIVSRGSIANYSGNNVAYIYGGPASGTAMSQTLYALDITVSANTATMGSWAALDTQAVPSSTTISDSSLFLVTAPQCPGYFIDYIVIGADGGLYGGTQAFASAPNAPTLDDPANTSYQDASSGVTFTATYNSTDGADQNAYAARIKTSGATGYSYYNASTNALQSTIIWNPVTTAPSANWSWTIPATAVGNGNTYNWSAASQEALANLQGPFAPDFTFNAQSGPAITITAPGGSVTTATPQLAYTATPASGSSVTGGRWLVYPVATTQASGFSVDIGTGTIPAGAVSDVSWSGNPLTVGLQSGVTLAQSGFVAYAAITETGGQWSSTVSSPFTVTYDEPAQPSITATASTDPTTGCPLIAVQINGHDNLLSLADASFEGSVGTWTGTNCVLAVSSAEALDGSDSLSMQIEASGAASAASTTYSVVGSASYVALAAFRPVSTLESVQTEVEWFDGSTSLSTVTVGGVEQAGAWVVVPSVFAAPSTATDASLTVDVTGGDGQLATPAAPTVTAQGNAALAAPGSPAVTTATTGGSIAASVTRYYEVTAVNDNGQTLGSTEVSVTTGSSTSTNANTFTWASVSGAASYDVYIGTSSGGETLQSSGITGTSYTDTAASLASGAALPSSNTTAGATTYDYSVAVSNVYGSTPASSSTQITNGNATLSSTDYNLVTWPAVPLAAGASGNLVYDSNLTNAITTVGPTWSVGGASVGTANGDFNVLNPGTPGAEWVYYGTGSAAGAVTGSSSTLDVVAGQTYTLSAVINATDVTAGSVTLIASAPGQGTAYATLTQSAGVDGVVSASFPVPSGVTQLAVYWDTNNATVTAGDTVSWSYISLVEASAAPANLVFDSNLAAATAANNPTWTSPGTIGTANGDFNVLNPGTDQAAWVYYGTGSAAGSLYPQSTPFPVTPGATYTVSAYIDASQVTTRSPVVGVYSPGAATTYVVASQAAGAAGLVSATVTIPSGVTEVEVLVDTNDCTVNSSALLTWSQIQLTETSTVQPYTPGIEVQAGPLPTYTVYGRSGSSLTELGTTTALGMEDTGQALGTAVPATVNTTGETHLVDCAGIFPGDTLGYQLEVLSDGPSAYWPLADPAGSTTAYNAVGSGVGTVNGSVTFGEPGVVASDATQTAASFGASSGYIATPVTYTVGSFTIEAWINTPASGYETICSVREFNAPIGGWELDAGYEQAGGVNLTISQNGLATDYSSAADVLVNGWNHVAYAYDASSETLIGVLNGAVFQTWSGVPAPYSTPNGLQIASRTSSADFTGDIAHVAVYPIALSADRIAAHYNAALNTTGQIVQKWTRGGLAGITTAIVTRSDGVYLRGASQVNPATIPTPSQQVTINDYEVTPTVAYTYTAQIQANI